MSNRKIVERYIERGFRLVFYPTKTKGPREEGWTTKTYTLDDYHDGDNVGVLLGTEIQPGKFLCDIDFDWADGVSMARDLLPATGFGFGRESRKISHAFFTTSKPLVSKKYEDILPGRVFSELRGTKTDGSIGLQTMVPPSTHPTGEIIELRQDVEIGHDDGISRFMDMYNACCFLFSRLGPRGLLHEQRLALAGTLLSMGLTDIEVRAMCMALTKKAGNDVNDMDAALKTSILRYRKGEKVASIGGLVQALGENGRQVIARIRDWFGDSDFIHDKNDRILPAAQENIVRALRKLEVNLTFNDFNRKPIMRYNGYHGPLQDDETRHLWLKCETKFGFRPPKDLFFDIASNVAHDSKFHPVRDYLAGLEWDGTPRVDTWLINYAGAADNDYTRAVSALTLIAAVRRVRKPGCKFDELLVLESDTQGMGKSTALRSLCPDESWFSDDLPLDVDAKELIERTEGKWIIEAGELSGMRASRTEHLKSLLSRQVDGPVRMAYGRFPVEVPRQFVVVGTTNDHTYLHDSTGNRRFWPVRIKAFDVTGLTKDRDQLWAEAAAREADNESIRLPVALYPLAALQQERRRSEDPWEALIESAFSGENQRLAPGEVWDVLVIPPERRNEMGQRRIVTIMQRLGFRRMTVTDPKTKKVVKGWGRGTGQRDPVILAAEEAAAANSPEM